LTSDKRKPTFDLQMPVQVKICGITNIEDAVAAVKAGADALGFIFFRGSSRFVEPASAREIIRHVPKTVLKVGVFVNEAADQVRKIAEEAGLTAIQLHGNETPEYCESVASRVIKAFRIQGENSLAELSAYRASAFLLDSYVPGQPGGTGEAFNWDLAVKAKDFGHPIILAGGLTPENVADAVAKVRPEMVDVSSGVEFAPGRKDHQKVGEFIRRAKAI
jgi:phosphoribosylanthranilate isomerase